MMDIDPELTLTSWQHDLKQVTELNLQSAKAWVKSVENTLGMEPTMNALDDTCYASAVQGDRHVSRRLLIMCPDLTAELRFDKTHVMFFFRHNEIWHACTDVHAYTTSERAKQLYKGVKNAMKKVLLYFVQCPPQHKLTS